MRVLFVSYAHGIDNAQKYYLFPHRLINGFIRGGHNVFLFNDRDIKRYSNILRTSRLGIGAMNRMLKRASLSYKPDLIVLGHCESVQNDTLMEIYKLLPDVRVVYRNVDSLIDPTTVKKIQRRSGVIDGVFSTTAGSILKDLGNSKTFVSYAPNPIDPSIDVCRAYENQHPDYDLFFAGTPPIRDREIRKSLLRAIIDELPEVRTRIIGAGINEERLFGADYISALGHCSMGLIMNRTEEHYLYASDRIAQYLGNGLLTFGDERPRYNDMFGYEAMITFGSAAELIEKLRWYHSHDRERREAARRLCEVSHAIFDCKRVAEYIIDQTFERSGKDKYEWPTEKYRG